MEPYLPRVIERTKAELKEKKRLNPIGELEKGLTLASRKDPRGLLSRFLEKSPKFKLICEIKRASPSKGILVEGLDVKGMTQAYKEAGAFAMSVLTQPLGFLGSQEDLNTARQVFGGPILRKDFIVDPYQVYESVLLGADLILLIARILDESALKTLRKLSVSLGLLPLVELHNDKDLKKALSLEGPLLFGLNARDLESFRVDHGLIKALLGRIPDSVPIVIESGIQRKEQILEYSHHAGVCAFLVGEGILKAKDPKKKILELIGD
jgi:indole-3-glycerol phosphate synthase